MRRRRLRRGRPPRARDLLLELLEPVGDRLAREVGRRARHLHERKLEREPWVAALAEIVERDVQEVDQPHDGRRAQLVRLLPEPLAALVGDGQRVGHLARVLDEHQVPEMLEQVGDEPPEIVALLRELLQEDERARRVPVDDEVAQAEEHLVLDRAEQLQHVLDADRAAGRRGQLVECRLGVAEGAAAAARDQGEGRIGHLHPLAVGDPTQLPHEVGQPRPLEDERLAARPHCRRHLLQLGRAEDEEQVGRGLLDQLQQRVPGRVGQLVGLVEDVDLRAALDRLEHDALPELADVVDPALRGGVHLDHVERGAGRDRHADAAGVVGVRRRPSLAVHRLGEDARERGLARAARPGEEVGLPYLAASRARSRASARPPPARRRP